MLNALWVPLTVQDTALMAIAVPATTIRLDPDVIAAFRAQGRGWQSRINAALRGCMKRD